MQFGAVRNSEPLYQIQNSIFRTEIQKIQRRKETELPNSTESSTSSSESQADDTTQEVKEVSKMIS